MRHVVTVVTQRAGIGCWVTLDTVMFGPFYTSATAQEFARRAAAGVKRVKWSMYEETTVEWEGREWVICNQACSMRAVVTATAIRPSSLRLAWHTIRTYFNDRRIR